MASGVSRNTPTMHSASLIRRFPLIPNFRILHSYNTNSFPHNTSGRCRTLFQAPLSFTTAATASPSSAYDEQSQQYNDDYSDTVDTLSQTALHSISDTPPLPPTPHHHHQQQQQQQQTGAFQKLPMVSQSKELIESALRRAERIGGNKKLKNEAAKARNRAARQLDTLMKELTGPLGSYERGFPSVQRLHPFEQALLNLTLAPGSYEKTIAQVTAVRKASVEIAKGYAARASKASNKKDAVALQLEGFSKVEAAYSRGAHAIDALKDVAKVLRRLPVVDPNLPTVALVGAPNVGKSSLVQLLSSGIPEVQNYPFTTRSIKMGHFYVNNRRHQVTDTPGLLNRPEEKRNAMERLTLASLEHLPTAVLFVLDLTGECGTTVQDQWNIRQELKERFPEKPWLDVLSKRDLLEEEFDEADERKLLHEKTHVDNTQNGACGMQNVRNAVECALALSSALRISSKTGDGIDELKLAMLKMLEENDLKKEGVESWWPIEMNDQGGGGGGDDDDEEMYNYYEGEEEEEEEDDDDE